LLCGIPWKYLNRHVPAPTGFMSFNPTQATFSLPQNEDQLLFLFQFRGKALTYNQ